jgi:septum formation inhibitor MinC
MTESAKGQVLYDATDALVLAGEAQTALANADIIIDSDTMLAIAGDDLKAIKALQHRVEKKRTAITKPLNQAIKSVNELFRAPKDYLDNAEKTLKQAILAYTVAQEKIAAQARRQAEELTRAERQRLLAEQREQEQLALEAHHAAQEAQSEADAAAQRGQAEAAAAAQE